MAKINSNRKGKEGELELAKFIRSYGYDDARRGQQYEGGSDSPDVVGLPGIHIECKRVQNLQLVNALIKATEECADTEDFPAVFHRENRKEWKVTMWYGNMDAIYRQWAFTNDRVADMSAIVSCTVESPALRLDEWLGRAEICAGDGKAKPVLIYSRPNEDKTATMYLVDWIELYKAWEAEQ